MPEIDVGTEVEIGRVSDFFARPVVAGIELINPLRVGDVIRIKGHTTYWELPVESMQVNNRNVDMAGPGASVGIKIPGRVRKGDIVYRII